MSANNGRFRIALDVKLSEREHAVIVEITFHNDENVPKKLYFSNDSGKAEILGLKLFDGEKILEPVEVRHINLASSEISPIEILGNSSWTYDLVGEYKNKILRFRGGSYVIHPEKNYELTFSYQANKSEGFKWRSPAW